MKKQLLILMFIFLSVLCYGQKDTVSVIMLVCDTSSYEGRRAISIGNTMTIEPYKMYDKETYWQFGYSVSERPTTSLLFTWPTPTIYLDEKKQPLPKGIVVWISISTQK